MLDKIKQIKYSRLTEEEKLLLPIINEIEPFISENHNTSIFWKKNGIIIFEMDFESGRLYTNYDLIWSVYQTKFNQGYSFIQLSIKNIVNKHMCNFESLTDSEVKTTLNLLIDKYNNLKILKPSPITLFKTDGWKDVIKQC